MYALSALFVVAAIAGLLFLDYGAARAAAWVAVLVGGAALMLVGQQVERPPLSAALVSTGAAIGGFPLIWTLIVPVAVAAVIASSVALARRRSARA